MLLREIEFLERPPGQPPYVPLQYVRSAPGVFLKKEQKAATDNAPYAGEVASRWRGLSKSDAHRIAA